jgi:serine/threonine protein kinase
MGHSEHIMNFYEIHETVGSIYLIVEYLSGSDLLSRVKKGKHLTEKRVKNVMKCFIKDLVFVHSKNVMHRDIKPENLMFRYKEDDQEHNRDDLVLIDFGLASLTTVKEYLYRRCGTPGFVAPEIITNKKGELYNCKCDIFSAGIIFYIL